MTAIVKAYVGEDEFVTTVRSPTEVLFGVSLLSWIKTLPAKPRRLEIDFV